MGWSTRWGRRPAAAPDLSVCFNHPHTLLRHDASCVTIRSSPGTRQRVGAADAARGVQPPSLSTRLVDAGASVSRLAGRMGLATRSPPQFGQTPFRTSSAQVAQKVHSNVQMRASVLDGGRSRSQHSQPGRMSSMRLLPAYHLHRWFDADPSDGPRAATLLPRHARRAALYPCSSIVSVGAGRRLSGNNTLDVGCRGRKLGRVRAIVPTASTTCYDTVARRRTVGRDRHGDGKGEHLNAIENGRARLIGAGGHASPLDDVHRRAGSGP